ncbi:MAG: DUF2242 domain-containing protein [Rhodocyclaceae bacterium]
MNEKQRKMRPFLAAWLAVLAGLGGCATPSKPVTYQKESFSTESPFEHRSPLSAQSICESGQRALLSQGYQVDASKPARIQGSKFFQPVHNQHTELNISLSCLPTSNGSVLYASARQTHYELKARSNSAAVSLSGLGSIALPFMAEGDSLMKVGEETIADPDFYRRFFVLLESIDPDDGSEKRQGAGEP